MTAPPRPNRPFNQRSIPKSRGLLDTGAVLDAPPTIAVLDDEAAMRKALQRLLESHGYRTDLFESAESFLTTHAAHPLQCLILDLHMPGRDGFAVLSDLNSLPNRPAVIVLTGRDSPGTSRRAACLGASAYLTKPVDEEVLIETVARHLPKTSPQPSPHA